MEVEDVVDCATFAFETLIAAHRGKVAVLDLAGKMLFPRFGGKGAPTCHSTKCHQKSSLPTMTMSSDAPMF